MSEPVPPQAGQRPKRQRLRRLWRAWSWYNRAHHGYGWFTEGFDTSDLKEAKALLDELRS